MAQAQYLVRKQIFSQHSSRAGVHSQESPTQDYASIFLLICRRLKPIGVLRRHRRPPLLEAVPAEYRPSLCRPERNRGVLAALRTDGARLGSR